MAANDTKRVNKDVLSSQSPSMANCARVSSPTGVSAATTAAGTTNASGLDHATSSDASDVQSGDGDDGGSGHGEAGDGSKGDEALLTTTKSGVVGVSAQAGSPANAEHHGDDDGGDGGGDNIGVATPNTSNDGEVATNTSTKPVTFTLMQSSVCKVGDNSSVIGHGDTRAPLFETHAARRVESLQYFFSGNGLAPLFAVIRATKPAVVLGKNPLTIVRLLSRKSSGGGGEPVVASNLLVVTAVAQPDDDTLIIKLNFKPKTNFSHRLFFVDVRVICDNCELHLVSKLFKVATKPSRVVLSGAPPEWTRDSVLDSFRELRGSNGDAVQVFACSDDAATTVTAAATTTPTSPPRSSTAPPTLMLESIVRDLGTARGVFLLNFKTSTRCVQFFTNHYHQLHDLGITAYLAPKRHFKVGQHVVHSPSAAVRDLSPVAASFTRASCASAMISHAVHVWPPNAHHGGAAAAAHGSVAALSQPGVSGIDHMSASPLRPLGHSLRLGGEGGAAASGGAGAGDNVAGAGQVVVATPISAVPSAGFRRRPALVPPKHGATRRQNKSDPGRSDMISGSRGLHTAMYHAAPHVAGGGGVAPQFPTGFATHQPALYAGLQGGLLQGGLPGLHGAAMLPQNGGVGVGAGLPYHPFSQAGPHLNTQQQLSLQQLLQLQLEQQIQRQHMLLQHLRDRATQQANEPQPMPVFGGFHPSATGVVPWPHPGLHPAAALAAMASSSQLRASAAMRTVAMSVDAPSSTVNTAVAFPAVPAASPHTSGQPAAASTTMSHDTSGGNMQTGASMWPRPTPVFFGAPAMQPPPAPSNSMPYPAFAVAPLGLTATDASAHALMRLSRPQLPRVVGSTSGGLQPSADSPGQQGPHRGFAAPHSQSTTTVTGVKRRRSSDGVDLPDEQRPHGAKVPRRAAPTPSRSANA